MVAAALRPYPSHIGADLLQWLLFDLEKLPLLGLEAEDFREKWEREIYGWLASRYEDGVRSFGGATEAWDQGSEAGLARQFDKLAENISGENFALIHDGHSIDAQHGKVRTLRRHRARREVREIHKELIGAAENPDTYSQVARDAADKLDRLLVDLSDLGEVVHIPPSETVRQTYEGIETGGVIHFGYPRLDGATGGVPRGDLATILGCTSTGKTALALNIIRRVLVTRPDDLVVFFSCEMPRPQIMTRHLMEWTTTTKDELRSCLLAHEPFPDLNHTASHFDEISKRYFIFESESTVAGMRRQLANLNGRTCLVVVDFLQLLTLPGQSEPRIQIEQNCYALKRMAKEHNVAVLMLSQVPREITDPSKEPGLRHGKGSSAIEDGSDFVFGIWRPYYHDEVEGSMDESTLKLGILKNRHGMLGQIPYKLDLARQRVEEL